ncbi:hypothetical protein LMH87_003992 [Akanthomyces muscarius]|uniref:Uncharacterized protein n=1 Tax=Akanthomyces muscarius TaxID=2231603 RepID=A0A9W8Q2G7_AKAMU|nr:hypothetical protein LMH87_003992 [Akanthomyces muscarius]KAJ4145133.1 hypothetical protein LMH87_003992 [Akanthomyces muscarius]
MSCKKHASRRQLGFLICFSPEAKPEGKNRAHHVDPEQHRAAWVCVINWRGEGGAPLASPCPLIDFD